MSRRRSVTQLGIILFLFIGIYAFYLSLQELYYLGPYPIGFFHVGLLILSFVWFVSMMKSYFIQKKIQVKDVMLIISYLITILVIGYFTLLLMIIMIVEIK